MNRRTLWPIFAFVFCLVGAVSAGLISGAYIIRVNNGDINLPWIHDASVPIPGNAQYAAQIASSLGGLLIGFLLWTFIYRGALRVTERVEKMSFNDKVAVIAGIVMGLLITVLISASLGLGPFINLPVAIVLVYLGIQAAWSMKEQIRIYIPESGGTGKVISSSSLRAKILDTNVIIDGRIADICKAGFVEGPIYIPRFVLEELQMIADSSDSLKRARGRRGLDILNQMRVEMNLQVETYEAASNGMPEEVDAKLVYLAKDIGGCIVTNDYNLNKVAAIQGIKVLNINELANALKPVVLPGEEMTVLIVKEGKEQNQGIGYLDDGTMIVVERGRRNIGDTVTVIVTSILQTAAGKMIFANMRQDQQSPQQEEDEDSERNGRGYSGSRPRRKIR